MSECCCSLVTTLPRCQHCDALENQVLVVIKVTSDVKKIEHLSEDIIRVPLGPQLHLICRKRERKKKKSVPGHTVWVEMQINDHISKYSACL